MLHSGVTTIRENGAKGRIAFSVREAIRRGIAEGPSMVVAGRAVTITGGHLHWFGGEADGPDGLRNAVRRLVKEGADFIKIMASGGSTRSSHPYLPAFTPGELRAIVDEARRHERLTAAHAVPSAAIEDCLDAGLDMIIHCSMTGATGAYGYRPDLADRMAEAGVWVNPTMHDIRAWLWHYRDEEAAGRALDATDVAQRDELRQLYDDKVDAVRRLHAAGVRLMAGSDSAWGRSRAGGGWLEIDALTDAGLSPAEAIVAGTADSAAAIGVADVAGRLEPGRPADLLVVAGDPLADLAVLGDPLDVFQAGRRIVRSRGERTGDRLSAAGERRDGLRGAVEVGLGVVDVDREAHRRAADGCLDAGRLARGAGRLAVVDRRADERAAVPRHAQPVGQA